MKVLPETLNAGGGPLKTFTNEPPLASFTNVLPWIVNELPVAGSKPLVP